MTNRPIPDPVEATFRDLLGAVYTGDGRTEMTAIERGYRYTDDRRRGRARQWLAGSDLRHIGPVEPASPRDPDPHEFR